MIHVLNYSENIIDDLSFKQDAIYDANHTINIQETMETFDFEVSSKIAQNLRDRHRLLIQDHMGIYREFIIESIVDLESGVTEVQSNASYLEDIRTAKPVKPHSFKDQPPTVMMDYLLADTGWEVSPETEVPMNADFSWDKVTDRLELLKELQDVFNMRLLFYVVVGKNNVEKRYVKLVEVNPIFNGEEIDYKENLIGLKREIDYSEVVTALLGVGPEDSETKKRIYVEVTDDKAQEQFGLPQRYIWDYYEVQVDSETEVNAGLIREETINELERRKKAVVTYDISSTDINAQVGDMIRVKDEDFNPEIYLEAEIVEIHYNLLNNIKEYKFGILKEFTREQVYSQYDKFRKELEERLKEIISNTDSIISERLEEELKYVERYIEKSPTPPLTPKEGDLWLDTTDPKVAILKRYENGKWVKSSVDHVSQIGGLTREETMYETLKERLYRIENSYFEAFKRHDALVTERHYHYVKDAIKNNLNIKQNGLKNSYDDFKIAFNNINSEQPTIGLITTAISRAVEFEAKLKEYNDSYYVARKEFDEVIALLQSQYSDEKFNEAIEEVAEAIGGIVNSDGSIDMSEELKRRNEEVLRMLADAVSGTIDEDGNIDTTEAERKRLEEAMEIVANAIGGTWNGSQLIADVPNRQELSDLNTSIRQFLNGEISTLDENLGKKIETTVNQAKDEFTVAIESVDKKVDNIESDINNLTQEVTQNTTSLSLLENEISLKADSNTVKQMLDDELEPIKSNVQTNQAELKVQAGLIASKVDSSTYETDKDGIIKDIESNSSAIEQTSKSLTSNISSINKRIDDNKKVIDTHKTSISQLNNEIALKVNGEYVKEVLDEELKVVKTDIGLNKAELILLDNKISSKVESTEYTKDKEGIISDIATTKSEVKQLSDSFTVEIDSVNKKVDGIEIGGRNLVIYEEGFRSHVAYNSTPSVNGYSIETTIKTGDLNIAMRSFSLTRTLKPNSKYVISGYFYLNDEPIPADFFVRGFNTYSNMRQKSIKIDEYGYTVIVFETGSTPFSYLFHTELKATIGDILRIDKLKVEKGNKATDWSPAPEDIENKVDTINTTVTKNSSSIGVLENQISLKADSTTVTQQLTNALKPIKTDVQKNAAELLVQKGLIEQRVTKTDYTTDMNGVVKRLGTSEGKISTLEKEIKLKVTETDVKNKIDNLEIGGRNLSSIVSLESNKFTNARNTGLWSWTFEGEPNTKYTASTNVPKKGSTYDVFFGNAPLSASSGVNGVAYNEPRTITSGADGIIELSFRKSGASYTTLDQIISGEYWIQLEKGNKPTDWTPAPEDMEERVKKAEGSITVNSDAIKQKVSYTEINKTNKTLERVISELIVDARGISYQYDVNGMIQGFTLNNQYFKLNHNLIDINNGDVVIQNGKTTIKQAVINSGHIKELSFDKLKGGTARFGGSDYNGAFEVYDIEDNPIMKLDYEQAVASELSLGTLNAEEINSDSVVGVLNVDRLYKINKTKYASYLEPTLIEEIVESDGGDDEGGTGTVKEVWACSTLKPCVQHTPKHLNRTSVHYEISGGAQDDDTIDISGFSGDYKTVVDVRFEDSNTYWYYFVIRGNSVPVRLIGLASSKPKIVSSEPYAGVNIWGSSYVVLNNIHLNGRNDSKYGVRIGHASNLYLVLSVVESFEMGVFANELARVYCDQTKGHNSVNGFRFTSGSILSGGGTAPDNILTGGTNGISKTSGAYVWGNFNYPAPPKPNTPPPTIKPTPPPAKPKRYTKVWETSSARTFYRNQPNAYTVTFMRDYPVQGNWGDGFGFRDGAWYFGSGMRNTLRGKKIIRVRVSIGRSSANSQGYTGKRKFSLRMHKSANKPSASNNTNPTFGSGVYTNTLAFGERKWFDVTSTFGSSMRSGDWYGFGVKTDSSSKYEYMALAKSIKVEVVYE